MHTTQQEVCRRAPSLQLHFQPQFSITKVKEFVYLDNMSRSDSKLDDSLLRYLTSGFLDKRAKSGERKPPGSREKVEGGWGGLWIVAGHNRKQEV